MSRRSRDWCFAIKNGNPKALKAVADRVALSQQQKEPLAGVFDGDPLLVPMPGSAPRKDDDAHWPAEAICKALIAAGVAQHMQPLLQRAVQVQKSSSAAWGSRPGIDKHFETMALGDEGSPLLAPVSILLIDDVVTKGTTALGAERRLRQVYPHVPITLFAAVRTMGLIPDVDKLSDPVVGAITTNGDAGNRLP